MGDGLQPRQAQEAARTFYSVDETENTAERLRVVRGLFEAHEFAVERLEALTGFGDEIAHQVVQGAPQALRRTQVIMR